MTASTVTIGVGDLDVGDPSVKEQFGFRYDTERVVRALVDDINRRGGVACRRLEFRLYKINPYSVSDQRSKCEAAARDDRVFAFLDPGVLNTLATQSCFTRTHRMPLVNGFAWPTSYVRAQAPFYVSPNTEADRVARNWVLRAHRAGFFDPSPPNSFRRLALLDCEGDGGIGGVIKSTLAQVGVTAVKENTLQCDNNLVAPPSQVTQYAVDDKAAGVTHVFPATLSLNVDVYLRAASSQLFRPRYSASDVFGLTYPGFTEDFDPEQWDGTVGYTSSRSGELRNGRASPETTRCDAVLRSAGVPGIRSEWDDFPRVYCDLLHLFDVGMARVPLNPTRLAFTEAVQRAGRVGFSGVSDGLYGPGEPTGADFMRTVQWRSDDIAECDKGDSRGERHRSNGCWFVLDPRFSRAG